MKKKKTLLCVFLGIALLFAFLRFLFEQGKSPEEPVQRKGEQFKAAIVLDDFGYNKLNLEALKEITIPLTVAVLPNAPYSTAVSRFADENGIDVILHLPMEPEGKDAPLEIDTILTDMTEEKIRSIIEEALDKVLFAKGISNHMGSRATGHRKTMRIVFEEIKKRDMFFLDSFTAPKSICKKLAEEMGVPYLRRDVFLDNSLDSEYIKESLENLAELKKSKRSVIGIGHDRRVTLDSLKENVPGLEEKGVTFVKLADLAEGDKKSTE